MNIQSNSAALDRGRRRSCLRLAGIAALTVVRPSDAAASLRLVSIGGGLTEIVYALQASAELVGVDTSSRYPQAALELPSVGYARSLSAEGVMALSPTLVIATEDAGPPVVIRQLQTAGIALIVLPARQKFEGLTERVVRVGQLIGREELAAALQRNLKNEWEQVCRQIALHSAVPARVLFVLAHAPNQLSVAGTATGAHAMLTYAGAINAVDSFAGYKPLTPEALIAAQPDVILLTDQGWKAGGGEGGVLRLPGLMQTPAGRKRRVISLEAMRLLGFGPRMPSAVAALHASIVQSMNR